MAEQRRLAAILAADMVGYSRLMEADEAGTIARQKAHRAQLIDPTITEHNGRIVKTTGDGMLVEFASVVDAVKCAVAIQTAIADRESDISDELRIQFRIGINIGDIIVDGDDLFGEGVNVAARLEGLCHPGDIYLSGSVFDQVNGKIEVIFENLGKQSLKNISKTVRVFRISTGSKNNDNSTATQSNIKNLFDKPSIAVLPFENLSNDPEQDYFSDGMAEDLITDISKISGLFVIARNSSFAFKGQTLDVKEIAKKLGVKHILEGSVRKMGPKLRVNAQLINAASGGHIWAERYDGDIADIFGFQDDIREQIVSALQVSLTPTDKALVERKPTDSVEAYDLFLRGRASYYRFMPEDLYKAIKCLNNAIEIDPNFADAYSFLAYCNFQGFNQLLPGFDDALERANELAEKGVKLGGTPSISLTLLGWIQTWLHQFDQAISNLEKALALTPDDPYVLATFGNILNFCGNPQRGLQMMEKALKIEPFTPPNWKFQIGRSYLLLGQYDQAIVQFRRMVEDAPKFIPAYTHLAFAYVETGRTEEASDAIKTVLQINSQFSVREIEKRLPYQNDDVRNRHLDSLRKAGLPEG